VSDSARGRGAKGGGREKERICKVSEEKGVETQKKVETQTSWDQGKRLPTGGTKAGEESDRSRSEEGHAESKLTRTLKESSPLII